MGCRAVGLESKPDRPVVTVEGGRSPFSLLGGSGEGRFGLEERWTWAVLPLVAAISVGAPRILSFQPASSGSQAFFRLGSIRLEAAGKGRQDLSLNGTSRQPYGFQAKENTLNVFQLFIIAFGLSSILALVHELAVASTLGFKFGLSTLACDRPPIPSIFQFQSTRRNAESKVHHTSATQDSLLAPVQEPAAASTLGFKPQSTSISTPARDPSPSPTTVQTTTKAECTVQNTSGTQDTSVYSSTDRDRDIGSFTLASDDISIPSFMDFTSNGLL
ncbi:hypothetical protein M427DRAFT_44865 [Gonapodya prolifera JEL478]|uniref:Uncharacterized protein n=1 Tax=Gonapodya prolifera (strain JEL478) TaxID=1344416 RepID=A0A139AE20_GONPJ|nr:hypothetical protein M427DRAFT_44865 [Gonapodya prolifera JEL478]|eukprot:KXS14663.1 hypothetical protein M427DRAFT_44865 [Gonapodya prolifera JEL478]